MNTADDQDNPHWGSPAATGEDTAPGEDIGRVEYFGSFRRDESTDSAAWGQSGPRDSTVESECTFLNQITHTTLIFTIWF